MEHLDTEEQQIKDVYAYFGLASYQAQCVERQLAILLATAFGPGVENITSSQFEELLDGLFKHTLGNLIHRLQEAAILSPNLEQMLRDSLQKRNWLAHHYFWERAGQFMTQQGRNSMIEELDTTANELRMLDEMLTVIGRAWALSVGMTQEMFDAEMEKVITEATESLSQ